jgi:hypothetical protein
LERRADLAENLLLVAEETFRLLSALQPLVSP